MWGRSEPAREPAEPKPIRTGSSRVGGAVAALEAAGLATTPVSASSRALSATPRMPGVEVPQLPSESVDDVAQDVKRLEAEVATFRQLDASRKALRDELTALQPKAAIAQGMKKQIAQLQETIAETDTLQAKVEKLSAQAQRLPELQAQWRRLQASAQEARTLKTRLRDHERLHGADGMEKLVEQLKRQEADLEARNRELVTLKEKVESMIDAAREVQELEKQFHILAPVASRLPMARAQIETLKRSSAEVERLEKELDTLHTFVRSKKDLQRQIDNIMPHAEAVEVLRADLVQLQAHANHEPALRDLCHKITVALAASDTTGDTVRDLSHTTLRAHSLPRTHLAATATGRAASGTTAPVLQAQRGEAGGMAVASGVQGASVGVNRVGNSVPVPVSVVGGPRVSLKVQVLHPLPGVPEEVVTRLQAVGDDLERHRVALEELESLDHQRRQLQLSIESLRSSPAALSVLKLQHELLELQKRELEQLEKQVESMAGVGDRLMSMRSRLAELEAQEEECMVLQYKYEEEQEIRELRAKSIMEQQRAQVAEKEVAALEVAASRLAAMDAQRQSLQSQIEELKAGQAQMHALERSIAALAIVPIALTKMRTRHNDLTAKAQLLESLRTEVQALEGPAAEADALQTRHAMLAAKAEQLPVLQDQERVHVEQVSLQEQIDKLTRDKAQLAALTVEKEALQAEAKKSESLMSELNDPGLRSAVQDAHTAEQELQRMKELASQLPSLRTQVSQLRDTLTIVTVLQSEAAALQQQLDAAGDVGALQTHVATLRSDAECVEELRREMCEITPLAEEAQILQEQIKELSVRTSDLPALRERHAGLLRDAAAVTLLQQDIDLLTMQATLKQDIISAATDNTHHTDTPTKNNNPNNAHTHADTLITSAAAAERAASAGSDTDSNGSATVDVVSLDWEHEADVAEGRVPGVKKLSTVATVATAVTGRNNGPAGLDAVFARLRKSEAERAGLEAENHALVARVDELSVALGQSQVAVEKLRSLVQAVGRIRAATPGSVGLAYTDA